MRVIIAGTRTITDMRVLEKAIADSRFQITEVVSGRARGADALGEIFAFKHGLPLTTYHANWEGHGKYAGPMRNETMARNADALIALWDGSSKGTAHMTNIARHKGLAVYIHKVQPPSTENPKP